MEPGSSSHQLQGVQTDHRQWGPLAKRQPLLPKMPGQTAAGACHSATGCGWAPAASAGGRLSKPKPSPWELPRAAVQRGQPSPPRSSSGCSSASFSAPRRAPASSSAWCQERQQGLPLRVGGGFHRWPRPNLSLSCRTLAATFFSSFGGAVSSRKLRSRLSSGTKSSTFWTFPGASAAGAGSGDGRHQLLPGVPRAGPTGQALKQDSV